MTMLALTLPQDELGIGESTEVEATEYILGFPVPGPDSPGKYVFLTLTPDGRPAAIMADGVDINDRTIDVELGGSTVAVVPKEAPWMLLKRELLLHQTKADVQRRVSEAYRKMLSGGQAGPGPLCPVHGAPAPGEIVDVKDPGQYL